MGDHVACFDLINKKIKFQPICCIKSSHIENNWVCITVDNKKIVAADNQKFYLPVENCWKKAKKLKAGAVLLKPSAEHVQIQEVSKISMEIELFDISVVDDHNYFVSNNDILVHNFPPLVIGVTLAFGGGAIEFAGISAGLVTVAGVIGLKLRKKPQKSTTVQAQELSHNIGTSAHYYFDHARYEVVSHAEIQESNIARDIHSYKKKSSTTNVQTSTQSNTNNCLILPPEDPEEFKKKHPHGKYIDADYHHKNSRGLKSPAPKNGQAALDTSVQIKDTSPRRVGVSEGEIVILDRTSEGLYHGHVRTWQDICKDPYADAIKQALQKYNLVDKFGRILQ